VPQHLVQLANEETKVCHYTFCHIGFEFVFLAFHIQFKLLARCCDFLPLDISLVA